MKKINLLLLIIFTNIVCFAQINTSGVLSNQQALTIAKQDGYQTLNVPIKSRYVGLTADQEKIINKLKLNSILEFTVIDPVNRIVDTNIAYTGKTFITGQTKQDNIITTYLAVALVEVNDVNEVRQHQSKNNAQTVDYSFRILNNSKVGKALKWFKEGQTITHTVDYINTSNGWKKDMADRGDRTITKYTNSGYGRIGLSNYKNKLKDIEFIKGIRTSIIGKWNRSTKKAKKMDYYTFNDDKTFEYYKAKKNITYNGKYKFGANFATKIIITLIPREGKNMSKTIQRNGSGMYIGNKPFRKEGGASSPTKTQSDPTVDAERKMRLLNAKKTLYSKKLPGYWKSSNGKTIIEFFENNKVTLKEKKKEFKNATYELTILNEKLYLVIFDQDLVEVFNENLKVVRADQMKLGSKIYTKF